MATIQSLGIGSGLDVNSIISKLVDLEKQPLTVLQAKANLVQAKISSFGQIQSQFSALNDAVKGMTSSDAWSARSTSSSNNGAATISATTTAQATSFSLDVDALAQVQSVSSNTLTAGAAVGAGTLTFRLGSWASGGAAFTPAAGSADVQVTVGATDKVSDIAAKINAANAGVTATAFNDGTNDRLLVRSNATGVASGFGFKRPMRMAQIPMTQTCRVWPSIRPHLIRPPVQLLAWLVLAYRSNSVRTPKLGSMVWP